MRGSLQCQDVAEAIEQEGVSPLPEAVREHLTFCVACQGFVADLDSIVTAARQFPTEVEPPARVWISLRAQLAAEGLIREEALATDATRGGRCGDGKKVGGTVSPGCCKAALWPRLR